MSKERVLTLPSISPFSYWIFLVIGISILFIYLSIYPIYILCLHLSNIYLVSILCLHLSNIYLVSIYPIFIYLRSRLYYNIGILLVYIYLMSIGILLIDISILKASIYSVKCISKIHSGKNLICSSEISPTVWWHWI